MASTSPLTRLAGAVIFVFSLAADAAAQGNGHIAKRASERHLGPGDLIVLHFLRERQLSDSIFVDERGQAAFPKLGPMDVSKLTIGGLLDTLRVRYSEYLRVPEFQFAAFRRVTVNGEVKIPNVYFVDAASGVRDVIAKAGGIIETGSRGRVAIIRGDKRIPLDGWDRENAPQVDLESGDQIVVGRKSWLALNLLSAISTGILVTSFVIQIAK